MSCIPKQKICDEPVGQHMVKRLKLDFDDLTEWKSNVTILNVIDDCLVEVFMYLNLQDLLNVGASNSRFKIATERAFVRKHLKTSVTVSNVDTALLESSLNILQTFGHCITKLCIKFKLENIGRLLEASAAHSGDTTIKLKFCHEEEQWYMGLHRTGLRRIKRQLRELKIKFPHLLRLKFEYNDFVDCPYSDDIIQAIPTLLHFSATGLILSHDDVNRFIALNGQLESLKLWVPNGFVTQSFINNLDASLPRLKSLKMNRVAIEGTLDPIRPFHFNNLTKLTYGMVSAPFPVNGLSSLFGEEIEDLELYCYDYVITNLVESISHFRKLKKLILYSPYSVPRPSLQAYDMSIVSPMTIRELILRNNQLAHIETVWYCELKDFKLIQNKYNVFNNELRAVRWNMRVRQWFENGDLRSIRMEQKFCKEKEN